MVFIPTARQAWGGVPFRDDHTPDPKEIIVLIESLVTAVQSGQVGLVSFATKTEMDADLAHAAGTTANVYADATPANNTLYLKYGASGSGSWSAIPDFRNRTIALTNTGAGTVNDVQATSTVAIPTTAYSVIYLIEFVAANTGPMTLSINGEAAKPLVSNLSGASIAAGSVDVNRGGIILDDGTSYRLIIDGDASADRAVAEAARDAAEAAAASAASEVATAVAGVTFSSPVRNAANATTLAAASDGTIGFLNGVAYKADSSATGAASATNDLGVDGLVYLDPLQFDDIDAIFADTTTAYPDGTLLVSRQNGVMYEVSSTGTETTAGGVSIEPLSFPTPHLILKRDADPSGTSDSSAAINRQLDNEGTAYLPAGTYRVDSQINVDAAASRSAGPDVRGDGPFRTIIDNRVANGWAFDFDQSAGFQFNLMGSVRDLSITQSTAPAVSGGIRFRASQFMKVENVYIDDLTGDGITIVNNTQFDTDQNVHFSIYDSEIRRCDGWGINMDYTTSTAAGYDIRRNRILDCAGAIRAASAHGTIMNNGIAQSVTNPQVLVDHHGLANNYDLRLINNFFEKGRAGELQIDGLTGGDISFNTFTSNDASSGDFAVKLGYDQSVRGVILRQNRHVVNSAIAAAYSCYDFGTNATGNYLLSPDYNDISTATKVNFASGAENNGNIIETGNGSIGSGPRLKQQRITTSASSVTPDLSEGAWLQYFLTGSAVTINKPSNGNAEGAELILGLRNGSGGSISVTFGTGWSTKSYSNPANGVHTYARFIYDGQSSLWRQVGAWS